MTDGRSRISDAAGVGDVRTRLRIFDEEPRIDVSAARAVWRRARDAFVRDRPSDRGGEIVHRLFWGREGALFSRDLGRAPRDFAVLGRHSRCDLRVLDAEVSLRHLLIQGTRLPDGRRVVRMLDLRAQLPFHLLDDEPRRSVVATGPLVARVGRWVVVAFPIDGSTPPADPPEIAVAEVPDLASAVRSDPDESSAGSRISAVPRSTEMTALEHFDVDVGDAAITVARGDLRARVSVSREDLERGVLIGRASRCVDGGIREVLDTHISRAHVLLISDGSDVFAYDLASTNGMYVDGRPVRSLRLDDQGTRLSLAKRSGVVVRYRRRVS